MSSNIGGYHEYIEGYHDACGDAMSTLGVFSTSGDTMSTLGNIMSTSMDVQYIGGYHDTCRGAS